MNRYIIIGAGAIGAGQQSTWQSLVRGSSHELDFLNGEVVLLGRLHGVPTPFNAAIQQAVGRLAQPGRLPPDGLLADVEELWQLAGELASA